MHFGVFNLELPRYFDGRLAESVINIIWKSCVEYFQYFVGRLIAIIAVLSVVFLSIMEFFVQITVNEIDNLLDIARSISV
jgi:hypothetical protein